LKRLKLTPIPPWTDNSSKSMKVREVTTLTAFSQIEATLLIELTKISLKFTVLLKCIIFRSRIVAALLKILLLN
jgi:hypothetical protein